jgi:hypothetical protein
VTAAFAYVLAPLLAAAGLRIETATPGALCPAVASVRDAVDARLGEIEGTGEWRASYSLVHRPEGEQADVVRLELHDPAGELRLRRDLTRAGQSCTAVTQAIVLVLESFFRRTGETAVVPLTPAEAVVATPAPAPPPARGRRPVPALAVLGGWTAGPSSPTLALELSLTSLFGGTWQAGLAAAWLLAKQEQIIGSGTATQRSYAFRLHFDRRWQPGRVLTARVGPEIVFALDRASAPVPGGMTSFRAAFGAGANAALEVRLARWLALALVAAADYTPAAWSGEYVIENYGPPIFPPETWRFFAALGLTVSLPE